jgi:predicted dehydrogenase
VLKLLSLRKQQTNSIDRGHGLSKRLGAAIIGTGMIGACHLRAARQAGASIQGVTASTPERSETAARKWEVPSFPAALDAIQSPLVDVVHICTPNSLHYELAKAALLAGKHVICEKPLTTSLTQAEELANLAETTGVVTAIPFVYRYHPMVREARARIGAGELGGLHLLHGSYLQDYLLDANASGWRVDERKGGPSRAFADIGSHWCDLIEWITSERFSDVVAALQTRIPERPLAMRATFTVASASDEPTELRKVVTEDLAVLLLRTQHGILANFTVSQLSAGRKNRLWFEVDGAKASLVFDQEDPERLWLATTKSTELLVRDPNMGSSEQRRLATLPAGHVQGYAQCFEAFVDDTYAVIRGEARIGLPTFADGLRSAQIIDAVLRSSASSSWVSIPGNHVRA